MRRLGVAHGSAKGVDGLRLRRAAVFRPFDDQHEAVAADARIAAVFVWLVHQCAQGFRAALHREICLAAAQAGEFRIRNVELAEMFAQVRFGVGEDLAARALRFALVELPLQLLKHDQCERVGAALSFCGSVPAVE